MVLQRSLELAILDDDPLFLEYVSALIHLEGGVRVQTFQAGDALLSAMQAKPADCIVVDYDLGSSNGLSIAEQVRAFVEDCPPIIMLTGSGSERTAVKAFRSGFSDYVSKRSFRAAELLQVVEHAVRRRQVEHNAAAEASILRERFNCDVSTSLYTDAFMRLRLKETIEEKKNTRFAIVLVELVELAQLRSELGYVAVQRLFAQCANNLRRCMKADDMFGLLAPDGFLVIEDRNASAEVLAAKVASLRSELSKPLTLERARVVLSPRIGTAWFPAHGGDAEALIEVAREDGGGKEAGTVEAISQPSAPEFVAHHAAATATSPATPPSPLTHQAERRRERRQRVLKQGKIVGGNGQTIVDCMVTNLSPSGVRLRLELPFAVAETFNLRIVGSGVTRTVAVRWQIGRDLGGEYLS